MKEHEGRDRVQRGMRLHHEPSLFQDSQLKILQASCCGVEAVACNVICMGGNKFAYRLMGRACNSTRC